MADYRALYRTPEGRLRVPFASIHMFMVYQEVKLHPAGARAVENVTTFVFSAGIMCRRLKGYLDAYRPDNWSLVPIHELFLDTQGFFLFVQQYLEDLSIIVRTATALPGAPASLPASFSKMIPRLLGELQEGDRLKAFLVAEGAAFDQLKDLRDDILHRTHFDRDRDQFPHSIDVFTAGAGRPTFLESSDLRTYLGTVLVRLSALSALMDGFVRRAIAERAPAISDGLRTAISGDGFLFSDAEPKVDAKEFPVGTHLFTTGQASVEALEYFFQAGERALSTPQPINEADGPS